MEQDRRKNAAQLFAAALERDSDPDLIGETVSHYRIVDRLGGGGMGVVYEAEDTKLSRSVALKFLPPQLSRERRALERFRREARAAAALNHPHICTVYDVGDREERPFIAMELLQGSTLEQRLCAGPLSSKTAIELGVQVAEALAAAHSRGILHRDVKPGNLFLTAAGRAKVLDFGLAKRVASRPDGDGDAPGPSVGDLTEEGAVIGTIAYMSPEQALGEALDARSDVFSLGAVLYEMLTGERAFAGATNAAVYDAILHRAPAPIGKRCRDVPPELQRIVERALEKDRERRYPSAAGLAADLRRLQQDPAPRGETLATKAAGTTVAERSTALFEAVRPSRVRLPTFAAVLALTVALAGVVLDSKRPPGRVAAAAETGGKDTVLIGDFVNTTGERVFDLTLKEALAVHLGQSPFLDIFSHERIRDALRYMGRSPDEKLTRELAREIARRNGLKALLTGSISRLGTLYVISLEAVAAETGDTIGREQVEAERREQVLRRLGQAASKLRRTLGESLGSIERFDVPIEQATTPSLEALRAFSLGRQQHFSGRYLGAIPFYRRAIELDPDFALAYAGLAVTYGSAREYELAARFAQAAFDLRGRTSERERLYIAARYYMDVPRDGDKAIEVLELWKRTYPRDFVPPTNLAVRYSAIGHFQRALREARRAVRLRPDMGVGYASLALSLMCLNRFDEARAVIERARARGLEPPHSHHMLYGLAVLRGDAAARRDLLERAAEMPIEGGLVAAQAVTAAAAGELRRAGALTDRAIDLASRRGMKEGASRSAAARALWEAAFDRCRRAKQEATGALAMGRGRSTLSWSALALALCGDSSRADRLLEEIAARFPRDSFLRAHWRPTIRAAIEIGRNEPVEALRVLQEPHRGETGTDAALWPAYVRGLAYLGRAAGDEAMAEFQRVLDHEGVLAPKTPFPTAAYVLHPLARLGLARAAAVANDGDRSRREYEALLAFWRSADPDVPVLQQARREHRKAVDTLTAAQ